MEEQHGERTLNKIKMPLNPSKCIGKVVDSVHDHLLTGAYSNNCVKKFGTNTRRHTNSKQPNQTAKELETTFRLPYDGAVVHFLYDVLQVVITGTYFNYCTPTQKSLTRRQKDFEL